MNDKRIHQNVSRKEEKICKVTAPEGMNERSNTRPSTASLKKSLSKVGANGIYKTANLFIERVDQEQLATMRLPAANQRETSAQSPQRMSKNKVCRQVTGVGSVSS